MILNVSNASQFGAALASARSGDEIRLAAGDYGMVNIKNVRVAGEITITSADSTNQAKMTGLMISNSAGITVRDVEVAVKSDAAWNEKLYVANSERVVLDRLDVHGTMNGNPQDDGTLGMVRLSKDVTVTNSEFQQGQHGLAFLDVERMTIADNSFHDLQTDGIRGGAAVDMKILDNRFTDFFPAAGDHPDAIQFWTTGTSTASRDIVISGNVVMQGQGGAPQGIFFRDQVGTLPYENVTITGNFLSGTMYNGIAVDATKGLTITDNVVLGSAAQKSWIRVVGSSDVTLEDNAATAYNNGVNADLSASGNQTVALPTDGGLALLAAFRDAGISGVSQMATSAPTAFPIPGAKATAVAAQGGGQVVGTAGNDSLRDTQGNELVGGAGDDKYVVTRADTRIVEAAGGGKDSVTASVDFTLGDNLETLKLSGAAANGTGNALDNNISGNEFANLLRGLDGDDRMDGGDGNDTLMGDGGSDYITAGSGNDLVFGGDGNDRLFGDAGADTLIGGAGADVLTGGAGIDRLTGGSGADKFTFGTADFLSVQGGYDIVTDFSRADGDKLVVNGIDARIATSADDKFAFIATQAFGKIAGQLRYEVQGGDALVTGDVNGDGVADFGFIVKNVINLASSDFIL